MHWVPKGGIIFPNQKVEVALLLNDYTAESIFDQFCNFHFYRVAMPLAEQIFLLPSFVKFTAIKALLGH